MTCPLWVESVNKLRQTKYEDDCRRTLRRDELLVFGFIRCIQKHELRRQMIPMAIFDFICKHFYHSPPIRPWTLTARHSGNRRIRSELRLFDADPPENCTVTPMNDDFYALKGTIRGRADSPYEGGAFSLNIAFPEHYPFRPPEITFVTKIYHCNINDHGQICLNILGDGWAPALTISKVMLSICSLLTDPNSDEAEGPLVPHIAELYETKRSEHDRICREWTKKYAQ